MKLLDDLKGLNFDLLQVAVDTLHLDQADEKGEDIVCCCPEHIHGHKDHTPSLYIKKYDTYKEGMHYARGYVHCFACGYSANLLTFMKDTLELESELEAFRLLVGQHVSKGVGQRELIDVDAIMNAGVKKFLDEDVLVPFQYRHSYLQTRGISEKVQKFAGVGYDATMDMVVLPIRDRKGRLVALKKRHTKKKQFDNTKGADLKSLLYMLDKIQKLGFKKVAVTEAEIDALYLWTCGVPAVAILGSKMHQQQAMELLKAGVTEVEIFTDFDEAGEKASASIQGLLLPFIKCSRVQAPDRPDVKDANNFTPEEVTNRQTVVCLPF